MLGRSPTLSTRPEQFLSVGFAQSLSVPLLLVNAGILSAYC